VGGVSLQSQWRIADFFPGEARLLPVATAIPLCTASRNRDRVSGIYKGKYLAVYEFFTKVLSKSYARTYQIEMVLIGGERSDSTTPHDEE
jgi:hypothetical protein